MRTRSVWTAGLLSAVWWGATTAAWAQFEVPENSLAFDDSGTIVEIQNDVISIRDSKNETWFLKLVDDTKITITGTAELDYLRPGVLVQFLAEFDKRNTVISSVKEVQVISSQGKPALGLFSAEEGEPTDRPLRNPGAGTYLVKGKIISVKDGNLLVTAGSARKISAKTADDLTVLILLDDLSLAQSGDTVKVKAWYYEIQRPNQLLNQPGRALAEELEIELAKPLAGSGKKTRTSERPQRTTTTKTSR